MVELTSNYAIGDLVLSVQSRRLARALDILKRDSKQSSKTRCNLLLNTDARTAPIHHVSTFSVKTALHLKVHSVKPACYIHTLSYKKYNFFSKAVDIISSQKRVQV